jgi:hypothetical protein
MDVYELRQMHAILLEVAIASATQTLVENGNLTFIELYNFKSKKKQNRKMSGVWPQKFPASKIP